ncbi:VirB3 family type IV secretion system protein [Sphingomonas sp. CARO-RG-8B-R24-01]|uniref:type IV secretion system protein VirB3 n=1 Tax=Sphingomonas sp. CARO-RG-8B-R24-01 TaxID=2914831 RepID=UPI001F5672D9|nr:VirB3 family type IV secretion system protein [Sphingomonas sp. CARO-RG-8B-R24-01]
MEREGEDPLLISMTRPATFMNVPLEAAGVIMVVGMIVFGATQNVFWGILTAGPLYLASLAVVRYDMNAFRLLGLWVRTRFGPGTSTSTRRIWGGNTFSPTAVFLARRKGFGSADGQ